MPPTRKTEAKIVETEEGESKRPRDSIEVVLEDLNCGICCDLLKDARQTGCCGGLSCNDCITDVVRQDEKCPYCRAALTGAKIFPDLRMERHAAAVMRSCPNDGCDFSGKRDEYARHAKSCRFRSLADVNAELRAEIAALKEQRGHLFWVLGQQTPDSNPSFARTQFRALRNFHVLEVADPIPAGTVHRSVFNETTTMDYLAKRRRLPGTVLTVAVNEDSVKVTLGHVETQRTRTTCYLCLCNGVLSATRTLKLSLPTDHDRCFAVSDWLTKEELAAAVIEKKYLHFVVVASLNDIAM